VGAKIASAGRGFGLTRKVGRGIRKGILGGGGGGAGGGGAEKSSESKAWVKNRRAANGAAFRNGFWGVLRPRA